MKSGFLYGYPNKPLKKKYSYHGIPRDCLIQPDPDPFDEFPNNPACYWELIVDTDFNGGGDWWYLHTSPYTFFASDEPDLCVNKWLDGWIRYYFCEVYFVNYRGEYNYKWYWSNGLLCRNWEEWRFGATAYEAWFDHLWHGSPTIFCVWGSTIGSHVKLWRSSNGLLPSGYPV